MILTDINVLVYAHCSDSPLHAKALDRLKMMATSPAPFALCSNVIAGFARIVTNRKIMKKPSTLKEALSFIDSLVGLPKFRHVEAGPDYWDTFKKLMEESRPHGNLIMDAHLAAIAIENGCTLLTHDRDFKRFDGLSIEWLD